MSFFLLLLLLLLLLSGDTTSNTDVLASSTDADALTPVSSAIGTSSAIVVDSEVSDDDNVIGGVSGASTVCSTDTCAGTSAGIVSCIVAPSIDVSDIVFSSTGTVIFSIAVLPSSSFSITLLSCADES